MGGGSYLTPLARLMWARVVHITPAGRDGSGSGADDGERQKDVTLLQGGAGGLTVWLG